MNLQAQLEGYRKKFDENQVAEFKVAFRRFTDDDFSKESKLAIKEVGQVLKQLGQFPTEAELQEKFEKFTKEQELDFDQFLDLLADLQKQDDSEEELLEAFRIFDKNGTGMITAPEFRYILTQIGDNVLSTEEVDEILKECTVSDLTYNIKYEDVIKMCLSNKATK